MTAGLPATPWRAECLINARELVMSLGPALALAARPGDRPDFSDAWREALFASALQPSDAPTAEATAQAIGSAVRRFGIGGCADRMAQEFGDHPEAAVERMRWVCRLAAQTPVALDKTPRGPAVRDEASAPRAAAPGPANAGYSGGRG